MRQSIILKEQRADLVDQMQTLIDKAETGNGDLTAIENNKFHRLKDEVQAKDLEILRAEKEETAKQLQAEQNAPGRPGGGTDYLIGRVMKSMVDSKYPDSQARALLTSGASAVINDPVITQDIIYSLLANDSLREAGVDFRVMDNNTQMGKVTAYPDIQWFNENEQISADSSLTIGSIKWGFRQAACLVRVDRNVLLDSSGRAEILVKTAIQRAVQDAVHQVFWYGDSGNKQPDGLDNISGVQTVDAGSTILADYSKVFEAVKDLEVTHEDRRKLSVFMPPIVRNQLDTLTGTDGHYLMKPTGLQDVRFFTDSAIKTDYAPGTETRAYVGDFSKAIVGFQNSLDITLSEKYADYNQVAFLVILRMDLQLTHHDQSFAIITDITQS